MDENIKTIKENLALLRALDPECSESDRAWDKAEKEIIDIAKTLIEKIKQLEEEIKVNVKTGEILVGELRKHGCDIDKLMFRLASGKEA